MPHDHAHAHDHHHHPEGHGHRARPALRWSVLRASASQRVMGAAALLALLWLATRWAIT